jgi:aspartate aminotransferase-like enzyme
VDRHCDQAAWLGGQLTAAGLEVLNDVVLNQVVVAFGDDAKTKRAVAAIQQSGECWCGGTRWRGREAMRVSISGWATTQADMERTLAAIRAAARA